MGNKKNKTFAERAKKIVKSYKRAGFDPIEKAALESKLEALKQEQEAYKQANGMQEQPQMACGGRMYPGGGYLTPKSGIIPSISEEEFGLAESPVYENTAPAPQEPTYSPYQTSIAPSIISGATSVLGNMYLANQQNKTPDVKLPRLFPRDISLARSREAIGRESTKGSQRAKYITRGGARTRGEYMSNRLAADTQISGKAGEALSASYEKEDLINANMRAGLDRFNAEMAAKEEMINKAQKIKNKAEREAYITAAIGAIPQMTRDISATKADDRMINVLGDKYGWYTKTDPNAPFLKRKTKEVRFKG